MRNPSLTKSARHQQGVALLLFVIALVLAASAMLLKNLNRAQTEAAATRHTLQQLKRARDALVGYALNGADSPGSMNIRPGRLPCPAYTLDGVSAPACPPTPGGYIQPGRLPWRTLGLAELRDSDNEPLWYVPAIEFSNNQAPINSNNDTTKLRIDTSTNPLVAIILSPGTALSKQSRPAGNLAAQLDPTRYFEDVNALAATAYVTQPVNSSAAFNDRLLAIRLDRFMPVLERRVLGEVSRALTRVTPLPIPALPFVGSISCDTNSSTFEGLVPTTCTAVTPALNLPGWFVTEGWQSLIWYAMSSSPELTVKTATPGADLKTPALLISPGPALTMAPLNQNVSRMSIKDLLEGIVNTNTDTTYEIPINSPLNNDQLLIVQP